MKYNRKQRLKSAHNITIEQYNKLLKQQNNVCAICGNKNPNKNQYGNIPLAVDHEHNSNKIRGLLCHNCNLGLGHFKDNLLLLKEAIKYLEKCK